MGEDADAVTGAGADDKAEIEDASAGGDRTAGEGEAATGLAEDAPAAAPLLAATAASPSHPRR